MQYDTVPDFPFGNYNYIWYASLEIMCICVRKRSSEDLNAAPEDMNKAP